MAKTCTIASVDRNLRVLAEEKGLRQNWNREFLRNTFRPGNRQCDPNNTCSELLLQLEARKDTTGLHSFVDTDGEDIVDRIWFELEGGFVTWSANVKCNVILFDPTWGTNDEGFKLCCFTTVGSTGETEILAACLLKQETEDMFEWSFRCFASVFKTAPLNIYTDGDEKIATAIRTMQEPVIDGSSRLPGPWADAHHRLCVFHLSKNFFKHIKPLFGADMDGWRKAINKFWRIAKESDSGSLQDFDHEWGELEAIIERDAEDTPAREAGKEWLEGLKEKKDKFCLRYVWQSCTWGIHSTQRAESMQSKIKLQCCSANRLRIKELIVELDRLNVQFRNKKAVETSLLQAKQSVLNQSTPVLEFLQKHVNPYALKLAYQQAREATNYLSKEVDEAVCGMPNLRQVYRRNQNGTSRSLVLNLNDRGDINWASTPGEEDFGLDEVTTSRLTGLESCSCQFPKAFGGLPCRHLQHRYAVEMTTDFDFLLAKIEPKWKIVPPAIVQKRVCELRMRPAPEIQPRYGSRAPQGMGRTKRYKVLSLLFDALAEVATVNDSAFDIAAEGMRTLINRTINARYVSPAAAHAASAACWEAPAAAGPHVRLGEEQPVSGAAADAESAARAPAAATSNEKSSPTDDLSLKEILGVSLMPLPIAPTEYDMSEDAWWEALLGKPIAYKEKGLGHGHWYLGRIIAVRVNEEVLNTVDTFHDIVYPDVKATDDDDDDDGDGDGEDEDNADDEVEEDEDDADEAARPIEMHYTYAVEELKNMVPEGSVVVHYQASNAWDIIALKAPTYAKAATARIRSWMLLQVRPLGRASTEVVKDAPKRMNKGKPPKRRKAPSHGPTSRNSPSLASSGKRRRRNPK